MKPLHLDWNSLPPDIAEGLSLLRQQFPDRFGHDPARKVQFVPGGAGNGWRISAGEAASIAYARPADAFRALARCWAEDDLSSVVDEGESCLFTTLGVMVDVSRNGVLTVDSIRALLCRFALMGLNTVLLYMEDVYEVEGEPFWGYLRGAYTARELREIDDIAARLGLEMIPCIQTLAHLEQVLQWPTYWEIRDTERVLMADEERTYALIAKLIAHVSSCFRSRRIHLGMDEAHGIGKGNYLKKHGEKSAFNILQDHLTKAGDLCRGHGLRPMIWSDMFFRLGSPSHDYYDPATVIPDWVGERIPADVDLVYWDYYHLKPDFYRDWIERHRQLGQTPIIAPGVWTWNRFWAALPYAFATIDAAMTAAKETGLTEAFVTAWGDDGTECDPFSMLPAVQRFAEHAYRKEISDARWRENFAASCGADLNHWLRASDLDLPPGTGSSEPGYGNLGKLLLWQDPLLALFDPLVASETFTAHYEKLAEDLHTAAASGNDEARRLHFPARVAGVLKSKATFRATLAEAYREKDHQSLLLIRDETLPHLRDAVDRLWREHRTMWMATFKPFGWEVIEARYGRLRTRLETVADRLNDYLEGRIDRLPELETPLHRLETDSGLPFDHSRHARAATPSWIK